jgi:hypothetical protein
MANAGVGGKIRPERRLTIRRSSRDRQRFERRLQSARSGCGPHRKLGKSGANVTQGDAWPLRVGDAPKHYAGDDPPAGGVTLSPAAALRALSATCSAVLACTLATPGS